MTEEQCKRSEQTASLRATSHWIEGGERRMTSTARMRELGGNN